MFKPVPIEIFLSLAREHPVVDVRAPIEFKNGHIPGTYNVPLFSDDQRALVGTIYKQQGKHEAIRVGLELVKPQLKNYSDELNKILTHHAQTTDIIPNDSQNHVPRTEMQNSEDLWNIIKPIVENARQDEFNNPNETSPKTVLVYCARGGMRSKSFCMFLASCGYTVYQLIDGYKGFKQYLRTITEKPYLVVLLGGKTGCGKTALLHELKNLGEQVIDLEGLACHKGSVFGGIAQQEQPSQEQFIITCLTELAACDSAKIIWIEKESYKIGNLSIPSPIWDCMAQAPIVYIDIPQAQRLACIMADYGSATVEQLKQCIQVLIKKLGGARTQLLCAELDAGNVAMVATTLLDYYDQSYLFSLEKNKDARVTHIVFEHETPREQAEKIKIKGSLLT